MCEVRLTGVSFSFGAAPVLDGISLCIPAGDFVVMVGPNGAGKSTLLKIASGLIRPVSGEVLIAGEEPERAQRRGLIGYVPQNYGRNMTGFPATAADVVALGLVAGGRSGKISRQGARHIVDHMLDLVGANEFRHRRVGELSGGEQQRIMVGRALASNPQLLLLDEPTSGIDFEASSKIYELLDHLNKNLGISVIMVSHDIDNATRSASHVACINRGLCYFGSSQDFRAQHLLNPHLWYYNPAAGRGAPKMGIEFLEYDFMRRALLAGWIVALVCPMLGIFIVVRKQSLIGDGLGHLAFAGVTGGYLAGIYPLAGALLFTAAGAVGIEWIRRRQSSSADVSLALIFYSGMAMAIIFSTVTRMPSSGLLGFLFGSILTVSWQDIGVIGVCGMVAGVIIWRLFDQLVLLCFDEEVAKVSGVATGFISLVLSLLTAVVVVIGMMIVGVLLVSAMMVIPVAAAELLGRGFKTTLLAAVVIAFIAVTLGLLVSFYGNVAPGGAVIMTTVLIYILILALRPWWNGK